MRPSQICGAAYLALVSLSASAGQISYNFNATATDGPLASSVATGSFSYNSSIVVPDGTLSATGLLTNLSFVWHGITYDSTTANTGFLSFDSAGQLSAPWSFGSNCDAGHCNTSIGTESWFISGNFAPTGGATFAYCIAGGGCGSGTATISSAAPIPVVSQPAAIVALFAAIFGSTILLRHRLTNRALA